MKMLHDTEVRRNIESRLAALRPDAKPQWGSMSPDQMLWHLSQFLEFAMGEGSYPRGKMPMPLPIMRLFVLYMPWPKNAPTHPSAKARATYDFDAERQRCFTLLQRFVTRPVDGAWPEDPAWGNAGGRFASRLQARHIDWHLSQFNV